MFQGLCNGPNDEEVQIEQEILNEKKEEERQKRTETEKRSRFDLAGGRGADLCRFTPSGRKGVRWAVCAPEKLKETEGGKRKAS